MFIDIRTLVQMKSTYNTGNHQYPILYIEDGNLPEDAETVLCMFTNGQVRLVYFLYYPKGSKYRVIDAKTTGEYTCNSGFTAKSFCYLPDEIKETFLDYTSHQQL